MNANLPGLFILTIKHRRDSRSQGTTKDFTGLCSVGTFLHSVANGCRNGQLVQRSTSLGKNCASLKQLEVDLYVCVPAIMEVWCSFFCSSEV